MERKDYEEKFRAVKNEILEEIRKLIPINSVHYFSDCFYVHYIDGEVAAIEICAAVEVDKNEMVIFHVRPEGYKTTEMVEGDEVFKYGSDTFLDILDHLRKEIREKKLAQLQEIVKKHDGKLSFDGFFEFVCDDTEDNSKANLSHSDLIGLELKDDGKLYVLTRWHEDGEQYGYNQDCIIDEEIDRMLDYVKETCTKKFSIYVHGSYGRVFEDIEAETYEEALAIAQKMWDKEPLNKEDSNGEDWEPWNG